MASARLVLGAACVVVGVAMLASAACSGPGTDPEEQVSTKREEIAPFGIERVIALRIVMMARD